MMVGIVDGNQWVIKLECDRPMAAQFCELVSGLRNW
jgi:hypothetical protein